MDSHQPADPWGITEVQDDDAEGVVATAPKEPDPGTFGDDDTESDDVVTAAVESVEEPEEAEPPFDEPPVGAVEDVDDDLEDDAPDPDPVAEDAVWTADSVVAEATELIAAVDESAVVEEAAVVDESVVDDSPKFDLGLDDDTTGRWGEEAQSFETGTAFDLIPPSAEGDEAPQYEIDEPELSEAFVATSPEGRPDVGMAHLADPDPLMAVPEESMPEPVSDPQPEESSSFRLPGLFGRRKIAEEDTADEEAAPEPVAQESVEESPDETLEPSVDIIESVVVEVPEEVAVEDPVEDDPPVPAAWGSVPKVTADPHSPFNGHAVAQVVSEEPSVETDADEPDAPVLDETPDEEDPVDEVEVPEPVEEELDDVEAVEPVADLEPEAVADDSDDEPVEDLAENVVELPVVKTVTGPEGEDTMEIELTEPDLSELEDQDQLYVTEDATHEDRPPALLTVDSVPGATIAQAVDVVTAVASASNEEEIAGAMDRVLGQLRDKAHTLGGEAVISVHTEVQEMGGGFLVTGSGTAVTLA